MMHDILIVAVISAVTIMIRVLPFIIFRDKDDVPQTVRYLVEVLPGAVMGMLVVYCLKDIDLSAAGHGVPQILSVIATAAAYLWRRDTSLSVIIGTACYMILTALVGA